MSSAAEAQNVLGRVLGTGVLLEGLREPGGLFRNVALRSQLQADPGFQSSAGPFTAGLIGVGGGQRPVSDPLEAMYAGITPEQAKTVQVLGPGEHPGAPTQWQPNFPAADPNAVFKRAISGLLTTGLAGMTPAERQGVADYKLTGKRPPAFTLDQIRQLFFDGGPGPATGSPGGDETTAPGGVIPAGGPATGGPGPVTSGGRRLQANKATVNTDTGAINVELGPPPEPIYKNVPAGTPVPGQGPLTKPAKVGSRTFLLPTPQPGQLQNAQRTQNAVSALDDLQGLLNDPSPASQAAVQSLGVVGTEKLGGLGIPHSNPTWFRYKYLGGLGLSPEQQHLMESIGYFHGTGFQGLLAGIRNPNVIADIQVHLPTAQDTPNLVQSKVNYLRGRYSDLLANIPSAQAAGIGGGPTSLPPTTTRTTTPSGTTTTSTLPSIRLPTGTLKRMSTGDLLQLQQRLQRGQ